VWIKGNVLFGNKKGITENMVSDDYFLTEEMMKQWVKGVVDSFLVLFK